MKGIFGKKATPNAKLIQVRMERELKELDVAKQIDVHLVTYCRWESGKQKPGLRHLRLLCQFLEKKPEELGYNLDEIGK